MPESARASFVAEPPLSDEYTVAALDTEVRRDLRGLQKDTADSVARHLVAAGSLVEDDPAMALEHARYARRRASRIAVVREAAGIAAYHAEEWTEALAELRAARRMGGGPIHLPVMADIERALGRPERAIDIARSPEASELGTAGRIELAIVAAGARRDLGELDAAVVGLQIPELDPAGRDPWSARLFYAYADNLLAAGREADALQWFVHASDADVEGETDAFGRIAELTGEDPDDADDFAFGVEDVDDAAEPAGAEAVDGADPTDGAAPAEVAVATDDAVPSATDIVVDEAEPPADEGLDVVPPADEALEVEPLAATTGRATSDAGPDQPAEAVEPTSAIAAPESDEPAAPIGATDEPVSTDVVGDAAPAAPESADLLTSGADDVTSADVGPAAVDGTPGDDVTDDGNAPR